MQLSLSKRLKEGAFLILVALGAYFLLALASFSPLDPGWAYVGPREEAGNAGGPLGAWTASVLYSLFGLLAFLFPLIVAWSGWLLFRDRDQVQGSGHLIAFRWLGLDAPSSRFNASGIASPVTHGPSRYGYGGPPGIEARSDQCPCGISDRRNLCGPVVHHYHPPLNSTPAQRTSAPAPSATCPPSRS